MTIRVLAIEDSRDFSALIEIWLSRRAQNIAFELTLTESLAHATMHLANEEYDVVLVDLSLIDTEGTSGLQTLLIQKPRIPMVVLSGTEDDRTAELSIVLGAEDFIGKSECNREVLISAILQAIVRHFEANCGQIAGSGVNF